MNKTALLGAAALILAGCAQKKQELFVYTWADYIEPGLVTAFEQQNNCTVVIDTFDSNETMHAKLKAGATGYDLITPSSYMVEVLAKEGLLQPLDHSRIPNIQHIDPAYLEKFALDAKMIHGVPYMISSTGIGYVISKVPDFQPSWRIFENAAYAKRMMLFNDMREVMGAALKALGYSLNSTDPGEIGQAKELVLKWKKNLAKFDSEQYKPGLASGEFLVAQGYSGDVMQIMEENEDIGYAIPQEGTSLACDDLVIPKGSPSPALAHAFIDFIHEPANAAKNISYVYFWCPNKAAYPLLEEEVRTDESLFPPEEVLAKCEVVRDLGEANQLYIKAWDEIKARKE